MSRSPLHDDAYAGAVAIIGMAGRFCQAPDLDAWWLRLVDGFEAARRISPEELAANGCLAAYASHPAFVPVCAQMEDVDKFDARFFGMGDGEAREMDPQLRLMMEAAWHAFEHAGWTPGDADNGRRRVGVFAGAAPSSYWLCNVGVDAFNNTGTAFHRSAIVNGQDFLSTWISYKFGFTGPSLNIQTACSTGLVLVAQACQHLLDYSCDTALAVTASVINPRGWGYVAESGGILSPDGHCRPFDAAASGTLPGEGAGAVVLKRLEDAVVDGDRVEAVIRGCGVSNDGARRAGYAAPSADGQALAIRHALTMAGVSSRDISYVEAHGTGTYLGDPIEIAGLSKVFEDRPTPCLLGSLKGNLGHLGNAAGMASLLKTVLMLKHGFIPPTINFRSLNPAVQLDPARFAIASEGREWLCEGPRMAGVSAFGFGGTNCHVILEETPRWVRKEGAAGTMVGGADPAPQAHACCFSAPDQEGLGRVTAACRAWLAAMPAVSLPDLAWNLRHGRTLFPYRLCLTASDPQDLERQLAQAEIPAQPVPRQTRLLLVPGSDPAPAAAAAQLLAKACLKPLAIQADAGASAAAAHFAGVRVLDSTQTASLTENIMSGTLLAVLVIGSADQASAWQTAAFGGHPLPAACRVLCLSPEDALAGRAAPLLADLLGCGLAPTLARNGAPRLVLPLYPFARISCWHGLKTGEREIMGRSRDCDCSEGEGVEAGDVEAIMLDIWRDAFDDPDMSLDDDFYAMGGSSMAAVQILTDVEAAFGIRVPMTRFNTIRTARQLLDLLAELAEA